MKRHLRAVFAAILIAAAVLMQTGCAAATAAANGESLGSILSAASHDIFGAPEQNCKGITVSLPRHAGYDVLTGKNAYATLTTDDQRDAYQTIERAVFSVSDQWSEDYEGYAMLYAPIPALTSAEIFIVKEAVLADHPEVFWIKSTYGIGYNMRDGSYVCLYSAYSHSEITNRLLELERSIISILKQIPSNRSEYERELAIHDILVRDIFYDTSAVTLADSYTDAATVYGALVEGKAICTGYAQSFKLLCNRLGLDCVTVKGTSKGEGHMWNIVKLGASWYHVDVTWDDPVVTSGSAVTSAQMQCYDYLNLSDEWIAYDHKIAAGFEELILLLEQDPNFSGSAFYNFPLPACTSVRYNFYRQNAVTISALGELQSQQITDLMRAARLAGEDILYLSFDSEMDNDAVVEWLTQTISDSIALINAEATDGELPTIDHCVRLVRSADSLGYLGNIQCIRLVYASI